MDACRLGAGHLQGSHADSQRSVPAGTSQARRTLCDLRIAGAFPARVLIDATYTLGSARRSGIERVVNNLREHCHQLSGAGGAQCKTLMSMGGRFHEIGPNQHAELARVLATQANVLGSLPELYRRCLEPLVARSGSQKLKSWLLPQPGHMGVFKLPYRYWYRYTIESMCARAATIEPGEGDLLVLPDAYWARKEIWEAVRAARARGAFAAVVVYDLIPMTHPEFVGQRRTQRFIEYLREVSANADLILAISQTVRRQLERVLPELAGGRPYCQQICDFPLGAEFPASPNSASQSAAVRPELRQLFSACPGDRPYLTVAAFDPRKNHRYLLDAFDMLWKSQAEGSSPPRLCLVGRVGGRCEDVMQRIAQHDRLGKQLFAFHDLNDIELKYCYEHCRGVIFPSIVEGYGLPIVEALWHGARTFASDTDIHREVGGRACQYFNLDSPSSLVELLLDDANQAGCSPSHLSRPHTWAESAEIFFSQCLTAFAHGRATPDGCYGKAG